MYSEDDCVEALKKAQNKLGKNPSKSQYEEMDIRPSASTILRICGSWNEAKSKANLEQLSKSDRNKSEIEDKPNNIDISQEDWERLTPQQRSYRKNKDKWYKSAKERRERIKKWYQELKSEEYRCKNCGEEHPACLDFHHEEDNKFKDVSKMVHETYSKERILNEIDKCVCLCANCHRKIHYNER